MAGEGGGGGFFTLIASTTPYGSYIQPHTRLVICSTACPCFVVMLIGACDPIRSDFMADCRLQAAVAGHAASRTHSTPVRPSTSTLFRTTSHVLLTLYTTHHVLWDRFSFSHMSQRHAAPRRPTPPHAAPRPSCGEPYLALMHTCVPGSDWRIATAFLTSTPPPYTPCAVLDSTCCPGVAERLTACM